MEGIVVANGGGSPITVVCIELACAPKCQRHSLRIPAGSSKGPVRRDQ